ncbi:MAG: protein phosphatase 2C domain-containing protein [Ktedonobacterales bacterium]
MQCGQCGAALRPNARFCNACGASQVGQTGQMVATRDAPDDVNARMKRPPRPLRPDAEPPYAPPAAQSRQAKTGVLPELETLRHEPGQGQWQGRDQRQGQDDVAYMPTGPLASAPRAGQPTAADVAETPTAEYNAVYAPNSQPLPTPTTPRIVTVPMGEQSGEHIIEATTSGPHATKHDALSWPLPLRIIVGGRYRVEEVLQSGGDGAEAENVYRVADLKGYEQCWSCGATYGEEAVNERFCQTCGADMLSRDFILTERRQTSGATADASDTRAEDAASYITQLSENPADGERIFSQGNRMYRVAPRVVEAPAFPQGAHIEAAGLSDVGITRKGDINEDSFGVFAINLSHGSYAQPLALALVADGLGGHVNGQEASRLVTRTLMDYMLQHLALPFTAPRGSAPPPAEGLETALSEGAQVANSAIYDANQQAQADMGSTLVAALIANDTAYIVNAGDSRGYVFDGETLRRITNDHSLVEQLIVSGMIAPEERYTHPNRNQIFRSLGNDPTVDLDLFTQKLKPGMRLLLCSDGLWEMTHDEELARILRETPNARAACEALVKSANANGGEDNITAVVVEITG